MLLVAAIVFVFDGIVIYHELGNAHGFASEGDDAMLWFECVILAVIVLSMVAVAWRGIRTEIAYRRTSKLYDDAVRLREEIIREVERGRK
ncbi:hypothetical protein DPV79_16040 [Burkholderia reimsis]|uniref:Uncharacterized protein n=1 Tax=Burkholderia reimsis TaxID=2234132 RepID=A0A365QVM1_9BURK|nr:hypothetical protein DPV79_16040 [Burkholderia reimsis]